MGKGVGTGCLKIENRKTGWDGRWNEDYDQ